MATVQAPSGDWVEKAPGSNGVAYLLVDRQWSMVESRQRYFNHLVIKAVSVSGVDEASGISIDFDPLYESLTLHGISVWRNGVEQDRLDRSRIDLIQREKEMEYRLYDGSLTLNVIIEDIRPGDTVEYSYTIEGANPIFAGHFTQRLRLQWNSPVGRLHYRVLWPEPQPFYVKNHKTSITPVESSSQGVKEFVWQQERVAALLSDGDTPSWYDPIPKISMGDMSSWDQVVSWALPLYRRTTASPSEQGVIASISKLGKTKEQRLLAALSFVQEQIRYLGMEMGESSHKPSPPAEVLNRRYGDCKDKARLLVELLRGLGIEAHPALVNTVSGDYLPDALPSLRAFDHVIVQVRLDGKNYWLDPTRTHQRGDLTSIYQPDYDYALVVAESGGGLRRMSDDIRVVHSKQVEEFLDITRSPEQPLAYRIATKFDHYYADSLRGQLAESGIGVIQQSYLNYTARYYPSVELAEDIRVVEENEKNSITLIENYLIPEAWKRQPDSSYVSINFEPFLIDDHVSVVESPKRSAPYAVTHPVRYRQRTRLLAPKESEFENEYYEIEDSAFRFVKSVEFKGGELIIDYLYESLSDHVLPADIETHAKNLRDLNNLTSYQVMMIDPAIGFGEYHFDKADVNWLMISIAALTLLATLLLSLRYIYLPDPPAEAPQNLDPRLSGLSGWLILSGIALFLFPFTVAWSSKDLMYLFSAVQWSALTEDISIGLLVVIIFEVILNIVMILVSFFLIVMFVTKRRGFPKRFILFCLFVVVVHGADLLAMWLLTVPGIEVGMENFREFVRIVVVSFIQGSYFYRSQRVKATFTCSRKSQKPEWPGDLATQTLEAG
ncbi:MAG: DUF3857 domain-containing protein [Candidatus Thiodiazotropha sp.]